MGDIAQPVAECVAQAAAHYQADGSRVLSTLRMRNGKTGEIKVLPSGEVEIGLAGIPGKEVPALEKNGITARLLADNDCLNVFIFTYITQRDSILAAQAVGLGGAMPATAGAGRRGKPAREDSPQVASCITNAAARYSLPLTVFKAVIKTEGGWDGLKKPNTNGSFDMGRAQINTIHLPELRKFGISEQMLVNDSCTNVHVAAYRLRFEINRAGDFWRGVGNYHSRTPHLNAAYQARVRRNLLKVQ